MKIRIFQKFLVLFFCLPLIVNGQQNDNAVTIELSAFAFSIERPFTISVIVPISETRPTIAFPDIQGLIKRGTTTGVTTREIEGQTVTKQVITQTYVANQPGTFRLLPFTVTVNEATASSEGAVLLVRPELTAPFGGTGTAASVKIPTESGAAFLSLRSSKTSVYVGEGFAMRLSLFVSDSYPFELRFDGVDVQLQAVLKGLRPTNTWEEDAGIQELKGQSVVINGRKFTEYVIFQSVFFPLSSGTIQVPSVKLSLTRVQQEGRLAEPQPTLPTSTTVSKGIRPASKSRSQVTKPLAPSAVAEATESITFGTSPLTIMVRPLPPHPLQGQVVVGSYRLVETIDRTKVQAGKSTRYMIRVEGEGNIASLQAPLWQTATSLSSSVGATPVTDGEMEALPAGTSQQIDRTGEQIVGSKTFTYFLVPRREGGIALSRMFGLVYFDPRTNRYDTLTSQINLRVGEGGTSEATVLPVTGANQADAINDLYAGLNQMDSRSQPLNVVVLTRAVANVLLVLMILGMIFVFFRK